MSAGARRVLRIVTRLNVGGPARQTIGLAAGLDAHGFRTVLAVGRPGPAEGDLGPLARERGVDPVEIPGLGREPSPLADARALVALLRLARRFRPHVIHTHTAKAGALGRVAAALAGVPVRVHTFHGHVFEGYFGRLASAAIVRAERLLARFTTRIVALSEAQRRDLVERFAIAPSRKVVRVPPGVDLTPLGEAPRRRGELRAELGIGAGRALVGCVGRLVPVKAVEDAIEAAALLARERKLSLVLAGDGPDRPRLEALARARGVDARFLGFRADLARVYADLDVLLLTSRNEGTPLALVEAFAAGRPAVATRVGGVGDVFGPPRDVASLPDGVEARAEGLVVPPGRPDRVAAATARLLADEPLAAACGDAGRRSAPARFGVEALVAATAALYEDLLRRRPAAR